MPQLDITILFPQLFWLIFFFLFFYICLSYFFLPKFLTALKLRRHASETNLTVTNESITTLNSNGESSKQKLHKNLLQLTQNFELLKSTYQINSKFKKDNLDPKFSIMITNLLLFSDSIVLKSINLNIKGFRSR